MSRVALAAGILTAIAMTNTSCETSVTVDVENRSAVAVVVWVGTQATRFEAGESGRAYGPLNKSVDSIRVVTDDGEEFVLSSDTNQDHDIVIEGPPLRVTISR